MLDAAKRRKIAIIGEAIHEALLAAPNGIPNGHVYAQIMGVASLDEHNAAIAALKRLGLITETHNLLRAVKR